MALVPFRKSNEANERPISDIISPIQAEMRRLMDNFFTSLPAIAREDRWSAVSIPSVNIMEADKHFVVTVEVPGIEEKDIEISATVDGIQIKAERNLTKEERDYGFITMERSHGAFYRLIPFAVAIQEDRVKANLKDGVLTLEVPKAFEATKGLKKISIQKS